MSIRSKCLAVILIAGISLLGCNSKTETIKNETAFTAVRKTAKLFTTAEGTDQRLAENGEFNFVKSGQPAETEVAVFINPRKSFQSFLGIGGALTDASAEVFAKLPAEKQTEFLKAYYDESEGIGYTLARTNIHSCDFSSGSYTYVDEGDTELKSFSVEHDREFRIPFIKRAIEAAGGKLTIFASPWSPPAFMKNTNDMLHGGKLLPEYYDSWAKYFTKFVHAYEKEGIPIWGISVQNEPMATQTWESCIFTAEEERDFLKNHLGPEMHKAGLGGKKIIVWDHNRDLMNYRANVIFNDPEAAKYAWGLGFHWYESWTGGREMYENVGKAGEAFPDKKLIFTEGCAESFRPDGYSSFANAERYGRSMINDFNYGTVAWTDWNILLDERGGPNHVGNFCFAPVHADTKTGELIFTPSYYYIGHFSKFIRPGAKRLNTVASRSALLATSFRNEDGSIAAVIMNQSDQNFDCRVIIGDGEVTINAPAHSIQTLVF